MPFASVVSTMLLPLLSTIVMSYSFTPLLSSGNPQSTEPSLKTVPGTRAVAVAEITVYILTRDKARTRDSRGIVVVIDHCSHSCFVYVHKSQLRTIGKICTKLASAFQRQSSRSLLNALVRYIYTHLLQSTRQQRVQ